MFRQLRRLVKAAVPGVVLLALTGSQAQAQECVSGCGCPCECSPKGRGLYAGFFGGAGGDASVPAAQRGIALFPLTGPLSADGNGPLNVNATGHVHSQGIGLAGVNVGKEWDGWWVGDQTGRWGLLPAAELEGFYLTHTVQGELRNPNARLPEHDFADSFPINSGVFLANVVVSVHSPMEGLSPYIGIGAGASYTSINGANSPQVAPPEPFVNHFNSGTSRYDWSFALQAKAGVRYALTEHMYVFAEYRFLYETDTNYTFGPTVYPTHAPTTPWRVTIGDTYKNLGVVGVGFNF